MIVEIGKVSVNLSDIRLCNLMPLSVAILEIEMNLHSIIGDLSIMRQKLDLEPDAFENIEVSINKSLERIKSMK